jgi:mRNA (guanine-N7-)-methyltransferase
VQKFYDQLAKPGADNRKESPIIYLRGFNNWVKSILIRTFLTEYATVLDLCCGKGGDLNKWKEGCIRYLVGADISESSIEHCIGRYNSKKLIDRKTNLPYFKAEFISADCCQVRLRDEYSMSGLAFHMTSCQFSLHYAFESYEKASMMLQNACENLRPDGHFIGTTIDSNELIHRLQVNGTRDENGCWCIGNDVYKVTLSGEFDPHSSLPLFGCKYHFQLSGVVNVPEYLVYFPLLKEMLKKYNMEEVRHQNFYEFFSEHRCLPDDAQLLYRMEAFDKTTGTMSLAEWEAIGLYTIFVFKKENPHNISS